MASTRARKCHTRTCMQMMSIELNTDEDSRMHASRRERIRKCSAIVVLGSEDSMSDKERCIYDTQHREHKWQKIVKPVFFKQFSTIFERALAPEETSDERETMHATAQSKPSFWPPNTGAKRPPIFFSLLKEPHLLPAYDQPFGPPVTNAQRNTHDVVYERILAAVTRDDRPTSSRKHTKLLETSILTEKLGQKRPAHLRVVGKTSGLPLPHDTDSTFVEEQSLLESSISRTTRSKVTMQEETLKCIKAHPFVEKNLAGCENFSDVQKQYRLKGNKDELVPDTDGSLAYLAACRDLNVPPLQAFLRQIHDEFLFVRHNYVGSKGGKALGISLSLNSYPVDVDLGFCEIGSEGACALAKGINRAAIYRSMDLSGNRIGSVGMNAIAGSLIERAHYSQLKRLMLGSNQLCDSGALIVAKILHSVLNLDYLDLSCNKICTEGAAALGKALEQHGNPDAEVSSPQRTDSAQNGTTAQVQLRGLLHLDLSGNDLADSGTRALFNGMYKNGRLQTLILAHNYIGNEGAKAVSDFMIYNNTLTHLDVSHNKITGIAGEFIAGRAIKLDQKMSFLDISHNPLSAKAIVQIVEATRKQEPKRIRLLNLWNTLDDVNTGPRRCADKMFDNADELSAHIKEIERSVHEIKTTSGRPFATIVCSCLRLFLVPALFFDLLVCLLICYLDAYTGNQVCVFSHKPFHDVWPQTLCAQACTTSNCTKQICRCREEKPTQSLPILLSSRTYKWIHLQCQSRWLLQKQQVFNTKPFWMKLRPCFKTGDIKNLR